MDSREFQERVLALSKELYPIANRILQSEEDARDAVQEVMIKLWDKRKRIKNHPNLKGFVFITIRNYCFDLLKSKKIKPLFEQRSEKFPEYQIEYNDDEFLNERYLAIKKCVEELPKKQKNIILLRDFDGYEFEEIASITGLKIEHIRVILSRARKEVRNRLSKTNNYEQKAS